MTRIRAGHLRFSLRGPWRSRTRHGAPAALGSLFAVLVAASSLAGSGAAVAAPAQPITIWMAGDSTMANSSGTGIVGWGREFGSSFDNVTVVNSAVGGRSVQTWLYEGNVTSTMGSNGECTLSNTAYSSRWQAMLNGMKAGDYLVVQFGINDGDRACPRHVGTARFQSLVTMMARAAQARGAHPILVTSLAAIVCSGSTAVGNRGFLTETRAAGTETGAPVVDLHALSVNLYNSLKFCPNNGNYSQGAVGAFFADDHTHTSASGANQIAGVVAKALAGQGIPLAAWLKTAPVTTTTRTTTQGTSPGSVSGRLVSAGGKCLDAGGTVAGSNARINPCSGGAGQVWQFASDGTLRALNGSMCLDANARGTANGTPLIVYGCNGGANQQFSRGPNSSIVGAQSGRCVDVPNGSNADGTNVQLYDCNGGDAQRWTLQTATTTTTTTTQPQTTTTTTQPQTTSTTTTTTTTTTQPQTTSTTTTTTTTPPQQTATAGSGSCSAAYAVTGQWQGGFQGEVKVTAGSQPVSGWTVTLTFGNGQTISQIWGGKVSQSGPAVTVTPEAWNGSLGAGASTSFGFIASTNATNDTPSVTCS